MTRGGLCVKLKDYPYLKRVIVSRKMMEKVAQHQADQKKKEKAADAKAEAKVKVTKPAGAKDAPRHR